MKIPFKVLDAMVTSGASAKMVVDYLREKAGEAKEAQTASAFLQFRAAYPRRDGPNPWRPAEIKFNQLVKSGVDPGSIVAAAIKFNQEEAARGTVGTRFIPHATTWLNQHRFADVNHAPVSMLPETNWDQILTSYKRFNHWSKFAGPAPDMPGCRCPRELLVKHGIIRTEATHGENKIEDCA